MKLPKYPLEQVLSVKKDRVEKAQRVVSEKQKALEVEQEKLERLKKQRDLVLEHKNDKLEQLRDELDHSTTSPKVQQMKTYLGTVKEKLEKEEKKVAEQQKQVDKAESELKAAKEDLKRKRVDEEKIQIHKATWKKQIKKELEEQEAKEQDEVGQVMYETHRRKKEVNHDVSTPIRRRRTLSVSGLQRFQWSAWKTEQRV